MKLIGYELQKLFGTRFLLIFIAVLLAANTALAFYTCYNSKRYSISPDKINYIFELYRENPEEVDTHHAELLKLQQEQNQLFREAIAAGNYDYTPPQPTNKYFEDVSDLLLLDEIYRRRDEIYSYPSDIQKVIDRAYANIAEFEAMGIPPDAYTYRYQYRIIELYKKAQSSVRMGLEYTRGWGEYFDYDAVNIFIFATTLLLGSVAFAQDKNLGLLPIVRVSRHGRAKTAVAKLAALTVATSFVTLAFTFTTFAVFGLCLGFSSGVNAIQVFTQFRYSPYILTVGEYFAITVAFKLATYSLFAVLVAASSIFIGSYPLIYAFGTLVFVISFFFYTLPESPLKYINLVTTAAVTPLFERYRAINIFSAVVGYEPLICALYAAFFVASASVAVVRYCRGPAAATVPGINRKIQILKTIPGKLCKRARINRGTPALRTHSRSLFLAELYKTFIASKYIFLVTILLAVKLVQADSSFASNNSFSDAVYKEYMTKIAGPITDEKRRFIADERAMINDILSRKVEMQQKYINDEITYKEYYDYITKYNYALSRDDHFKIIELHASYIDRIKTEKGLNAHFVYDTGWRALFFSGFDFTLYAAIVLLFAGSFADEHSTRSSSGSIAQILRVTRKGRSPTFNSKLLSALVVTALLAVIWCGIDILFVAHNYELPLASSPLVSIEAFQNLDTHITIGAYLAVYFTLRIFAALALASLVCALSEVLKKSIVVLAVTVPVTLFPAMLSALGLKIFEFVDYIAFSRATPFVLVSIEGASDWGGLIVTVIAAALICAIAAARAARSWSR